MRETIDQLRDFLVYLSKSLEGAKITEVNGIKVDQRMLGSLENISVGDNSSVVINQNLILSVDDKKILDKSITLLDKLNEFVPSKELPLTKSIQRYKNSMIIMALEETDGNFKKAAALIGLTDRQFRYSYDTKGVKRVWEEKQRRENG